MKKATYITPSIKVKQINTESLLASESVTYGRGTTSDIGFQGLSNEGTVEDDEENVALPQNYNIWE